MEKLQNIIFDLINNIENKKINNIYIGVEKNTEFPYIIFEINNIKTKYCLNMLLHFIDLNIKILDKNNTNIDVIKTTNQINNSIANKIINKQFDNFTIIDIKKENEKLNIINNLNSFWESVLMYTILIEEKI